MALLAVGGNGVSERKSWWIKQRGRVMHTIFAFLHPIWGEEVFSSHLMEGKSDWGGERGEGGPWLVIGGAKRGGKGALSISGVPWENTCHGGTLRT